MYTMFASNLICAAVLALHPFLISTFNTSSLPSPPPQYLFKNPPLASSDYFHIPTVRDSAILARRMLNLSSIATLSTVFPPPSPKSPQSLLHTNRPQSNQQPLSHYTPGHLSVAGAPIGLMDYYAPCPPNPSDPTILALSIATTFRNAAAGSNVSLSLRWTPPKDAPPIDDDPWAYVPANMPRLSLEGYLERIPDEEVDQHAIDECFFERHGEARTWQPGNQIHESWWGRLKVQGVYWIGGFGDRAFIGWIPGSVWEGVTGEEVEGARLVGEEGYVPPRWNEEEL